MKQIKEFLLNRKQRFKELQNGDLFLIDHKVVLTYNTDTIYNFKSIVLRKNKRDYTWLKIISEIIGFPYEQLFLSLKRQYSEQDFFNYSDTQLLSSWNKLKNTKSLTGGYNLINHYHKSLLRCNKISKKSPLESINDDKDFLYVFNNRVIYDKKDIDHKILFKGLSVSGRSPRVSVFAPSLARHILSTYASDSQTVLDPFSGFSGRMLGALSLGLKYIGSDLRGDVISESGAILNFLNLSAELSVSDFRDRANVHADVLFTCPPYGHKEHWPGITDYHPEDYYIDAILKNFNCKRYIFVVKHTKYTKNIVSTIRNGSWIKSLHHEKILIF